MATHSKTLGSRKVEPKMYDLPKWQLCANFLLRELARKRYGKKSVFDACLSEFGFLFREVIRLFGEEHQLTEKEMSARRQEAIMRWEQWHGIPITFSQPYYEARWYAYHMLGEELANRLLAAPTVATTLDIVLNAFTFVSEGKQLSNPFPNPTFDSLEPLKHYEALPIDLGLELMYYGKESLPF